MRSLARALSLIAMVVTTLTACAGGLTPSVDVTTTDPSWRHWFSVDWTAEPGVNGHRRLSGWVQNRYGEEAYNVRLLAQALDESGRLVDQRFAWAMRVPALGRRYFEVPDLPVATHYRVTIWAFTMEQGAGWE